MDHLDAIELALRRVANKNLANPDASNTTHKTAKLLNQVADEIVRIRLETGLREP